MNVETLLKRTGALLEGHFLLSSGLHSPSYIQCALLLEHPRNASAIGQALAEKLRTFDASKVAAPALGGVVIGYTVADALAVPMIFTERKSGVMTLRRGFRVAENEPVIIVEDVVTTGKSTREAAAVVGDAGGRVVAFASILNRSGRENPFDHPYETLLSMSLETWEPAVCPLCRSGAPLDSPGSRHTAKR